MQLHDPKQSILIIEKGEWMAKPLGSAFSVLGVLAVVFAIDRLAFARGTYRMAMFTGSGFEEREQLVGARNLFFSHPPEEMKEMKDKMKNKKSSVERTMLEPFSRISRTR